jgi:hypothetical protein
VNQRAARLTIARSSPYLPLKGDWIGNSITISSATISPSIFLFSLQYSSLAMADSHPHLFQPLVANESEIRKLIASYFLLDREVLQWHPSASEEIPTPNANEIVVFASFFQRGLGLPVPDFLCGLLDHYQIELVHLNHKTIIQIARFCPPLRSLSWDSPKLLLDQKLFLAEITAKCHKSESHR